MEKAIPKLFLNDSTAACHGNFHQKIKQTTSLKVYPSLACTNGSTEIKCISTNQRKIIKVDAANFMNKASSFLESAKKAMDQIGTILAEVKAILLGVLGRLLEVQEIIILLDSVSILNDSLSLCPWFLRHLHFVYHNSKNFMPSNHLYHIPKSLNRTAHSLAKSWINLVPVKAVLFGGLLNNEISFLTKKKSMVLSHTNNPFYSTNAVAFNFSQNTFGGAPIFNSYKLSFTPRSTKPSQT